LSSGIAGPYGTKLLADAGADVIRIEEAGGDPLRRWSATGADLGGEDGALFRFLHQNKRALRGAAADPAVRELVAGADLVVEDLAPARADALGWPLRQPGLVWLSITPYGRGGPWSDRPATEFTIQADSGSIGTRGLPGGEPFQCGGRTILWLAGTYAAVAALAALVRAGRSGHGEHVDFSILEVTALAATNYMELVHRLLGEPAPGGLPQSVETPSIEPSADGYVGFCTNSRQQFSDFLLLIERPDLQRDEGLAFVAGRMARFEEWSRIVHAWTRRHTTAEIVERAALLRIPVAPVNDAEGVLADPHLRARGAFLRDPSGRFVHPRPPYRIDDEDAPPCRPAPRLGEHDGAVEPHVRRATGGSGPAPLPLAGLRVIDMTAWWAGPSATGMLAALGADVVHVESPRRPDGMRLVGGMLRGRYRDWWEASHFYLAVNTNKRGLTLDLSDPRGLEWMRRLIARSDALVDNFTPRVLEQFGLGWEAVREINPRAILLRMPAFGLSGPWRDHTGFAQTMEQISGLAWLTGHPEDQPRIQRGPCDPLAGMHAAFAFLVAWIRREASGRGAHVECTMVEGALNAAAEALLEWSAYGGRMQREGNRSPAAAPQGLYPCLGHAADSPRWLALSVATHAQWRALRGVLGDPGWARDDGLATLAGRRAAHDAIDAELRPWMARRDRDALVEELVAAGVPAAPLRDPRLASAHPQLRARGFYEAVTHPAVGPQPVPGLPFRYASVAHWIRSPAPTLGQHNREILCDWLGASDAELAALEQAGVVGTRPRF
jgi:crotonobetainyl-CoA:carnitine CoA-transferase CaiB-like acyl-CoA transferase